MRRWFSAWGLAAALVLAGCGGPHARSAGELNVYNWSDYIDPSLIDQFTKETGIRVHYDGPMATSSPSATTSTAGTRRPCRSSTPARLARRERPAPALASAP